MTYRVLLAAAAGILLAGCGNGSGGGTATTTTVAVHASAPACRRLNGATRTAVARIGASLAQFAGVSSVATFGKRVSALQRRIAAASTQIDAVETPPGPLTQDKTAIAQALGDVSTRLGAARNAAARGRVGAAARQFGGLATLTALRRAARSLARDCPG